MEAPKYQIVSNLWVQQICLIGNLESLSEYDGCCVYVVEGYFDAKRINDQWQKKSVALLSSILSREKLMILQQIKKQGHCLIYIPDKDEAGMNDKLINNNIWDLIYYIPNLTNTSIYDTKTNQQKFYEGKDIDNFVKFTYLNHNNMTEETLDFNINLIEKGKLIIPFHEEGVREKIIAGSNKRS